MKILIDNGHGYETPGKRSPDGRLLEYKYTREIADRIVEKLKKNGLDAQRLVTEEADVSLQERCRRANAICAKLGADNVVLVSIHCNAAGNGRDWATARGWSAHVATRASGESKMLALSLANEAQVAGLKVRKYTGTVPYWPQNLAICRDTKCPAVLTENLFMDNRADVKFLLSEEGKEVITDLHVKALTKHAR